MLGKVRRWRERRAREAQPVIRVVVAVPVMDEAGRVALAREIARDIRRMDYAVARRL
jgi:hypothetical protein